MHLWSRNKISLNYEGWINLLWSAGLVLIVFLADITIPLLVKCK